MVVVYILLALLAILLVVVLFLVVCAITVNPKRNYDSDNRLYRWIINITAFLVMKLMRIHVYITGIEKIPSDVKPVFVCNHRSNFDPIITWYILRKWQPAFLSKDSNFKIPLFGRIIRKCCFMPIDRENPRNALKTIQRAAELIKKDEVSIGVYPEGHRSKDGRLLPFHNGVFKIAQKANAPIVVLSIAGTEKVHRNYPFHASQIYFDVLDVLEAKEVKSLKTNELSVRVRETILQRLQESPE